jgi:hypothetical protein
MGKPLKDGLGHADLTLSKWILKTVDFWHDIEKKHVDHHILNKANWLQVLIFLSFHMMNFHPLHKFLKIF